MKHGQREKLRQTLRDLKQNRAEKKDKQFKVMSSNADFDISPKT